MEIIQPKEFREKGCNVEIHAIFNRHGEKETSTISADTVLTPEGEIDSVNFGRDLKKRTAIKEAHSDTPRTERTNELALDNSPTEKKLKSRVRKELAFHYDQNGSFFKELMEIKKSVLGADFEGQSKQEKQKRIREANELETNKYLSYGENRPDLKTYSPAETASQIAYLIEHYIKMPRKLDSGTKLDYLNGTHDLIIASFLKYTMIREVSDKKITGFDKIAEIGGPIEYNEVFEVLIKTDWSGEPNTPQILFRNKKYDIDKKAFKDLLDVYERIEDKQ